MKNKDVTQLLLHTTIPSQIPTYIFPHILLTLISIGRCKYVVTISLSFHAVYWRVYNFI